MFRSAAALVLCAGLLSGSQKTVPPPRIPTGSEALQAALRLGNLEEAQRLVASGTDVNARDSLGNTPLLYAAWSGNASATAFLLAHGADANASQSSLTPLQGAVLAGRNGTVKLLLSAAARLDIRDLDGRTLLHVAARYGYDEIAALLLSSHAEAGAVDAAGRTPLDDAALFAQAAVIPVLLRFGAEPRRIRPQDGRSPLHEASVRGSAAVIEVLMAAGADPAARDLSGQTPLDLALAYKNSGAIAAFEHLGLERQDCQDAANRAMQSATLHGHTELARLLLEGGFNLNNPTSNGSTYLHFAALKGQKKMVQLFLDRGAQINSRDSSGGTPLHNAALAGSTDVIALLLDRGARIDATDTDSEATPLMLAASLSRTEAVAVLLKRGANPRLKDRTGHTALDRARATDDTQNVKLLENALGMLTPANSAAKKALAASAV